MRVLHVVPYLPKASGVTTFVVECSDELQRMGSEQVIVIKNSTQYDVAPSQSDVPRIGVIEALSHIRDIDIVHIHGIWPPFMHRFVAVAKRYGIPIVWSLHGMLSPWAMKFKWWKKALPWVLWQKRDLKCAAVFHVTSEKEKEWVRMLGIENRMVNIPVGTVIRDVVRHAHDVRRLLFVGRIAPVKSLEKLLCAWAMVERRSWRLQIVGADDSPGYEDSLRRLCGRLGLGESVDFEGAKFGDELEQIYLQADALALVSETENFGAVVADALARGLPVVTSLGTPWQEVENSRCGWWTRNDADSLAMVLRELISLSDDERWAMGARGRELVRKKCSWSAVARQMNEVYESISSR